MKIAITSTGNSPGSKLDSRFGRCAYFAIYDTENESTEFIPNPNRDNIEGAGPASAQIIASKNVVKIISGEFGSKVKTIFDKLQIQLIVLPDTEKNIQEIIDLIKSNK